MVRPAQLPAKEPALPPDDKVLSVVRSLQQDIVFGRLKPRERLLEEEMSARFAVGRHVVRAVLEELDRAGLVVRRPTEAPSCATTRRRKLSSSMIYAVCCIARRRCALHCRVSLRWWRSCAASTTLTGRVAKPVTYTRRQA